MRNDHAYKDCKESSCCINCNTHNEKFGIKFHSGHNARDKNCEIYIRELNNLKNRINYGSE